MRTVSLAAALAAGVLLAACSKPEPAAGAPSPDVVTVDSATTTDSTVTATLPDSTARDSTMNAMKDSTATIDSTN